MLYCHCVAATKTGARENNQDNYFINGTYNQQLHEDCFNEIVCNTENALFAVSDGMGGERFGDAASYTISKHIGEIYNKTTHVNPVDVQIALERANEEMQTRMEQERLGQIGSTVVTLLIVDEKVYISNLGDSPAFLYRNGKLTQITHDHTEGQAMLEAGVLSIDQLKVHPSKNRLTRFIGMLSDGFLFESEQYEPIFPTENDVFLLCSDGVSGVLSSDEIEVLMGGQSVASNAAEEIVNEAIKHGSRDNSTAIVIKISSNPLNDFVIKERLIGGSETEENKTESSAITQYLQLAKLRKLLQIDRDDRDSKLAFNSQNKTIFKKEWGHSENRLQKTIGITLIILGLILIFAYIVFVIT